MKSEIDRGGARHPLIELALARLREFAREPEALFWTFVFPIVMSVALAIAFPGSGGKPAVVAVEPGDRSTEIRQALSAAPGITIRDVRPGDEQRALREGEVHLLIVPTDPPSLSLRRRARREPHRAPARGRCVEAGGGTDGSVDGA